MNQKKKFLNTIFNGTLNITQKLFSEICLYNTVNKQINCIIVHYNWLQEAAETDSEVSYK